MRTGAVMACVIGLTIVLLQLFDCQTAVAQLSGEPAERTGTTAREAAEAARRSTIAQKDDLEQTIRRELDGLQAEVRAWQGKTDALSGEARAELERAIKRLEMRKDLARRQLQDLRRTTASTWARWQERMVQALDDVKRAYREAVTALP